MWKKLPTHRELVKEKVAEANEKASQNSSEVSAYFNCTKLFSLKRLLLSLYFLFVVFTIILHFKVTFRVLEKVGKK